jgi:TetR/AcrR family transcriptional regulator, transcriptional repressor for nem operon
MPKRSKKPVKTRDFQRTRQRILQGGFEEIFRRGFHGASVNAIIAHCETTKGGFFHHFATKEELGLAIVDELLSAMVRERWLNPLEQFENPLEGIVQNWKRVIADTPDAYIILGCPLNNLIQEMTHCDERFAARLKQVFSLWVDGVESQLAKAVTRGYMRKGAPLRQLAEFIVMSHEGAFATAKALNDPRVFARIQGMVHEVLGSYSTK